MRNMIIEVSALNPKTKLIEVVRMASANASAEGVYLDGKTWLPAITSDNEVSLAYWGEGRAQPLTVSYGSISFILSRTLGNTAWKKLRFDGASATVWVGEMGAPFSAYEQTWTGILGPLGQDDSRHGKLTLLGAEAQFNRPLLDRAYQGTGGVEGPSSILGKLKPYSLGLCVNVEPFKLDPIKLVYQVNAYASTPINAVYSSALTLGAAKTDVATYADLIALTLKPGEWASCAAAGMLRLGGDPGSAKITADIGTATNAQAIARALALKSGLLASRLGTSFAPGLERILISLDHSRRS